MFHRKVHPVNTIDEKNHVKSHKGKIKNTPQDCFQEYDNGDPANPEFGRRFDSDAKSGKWSQDCKTNWNPPQHGLSCSSSTGNNEHWIKTDTECKYYIALECNSHTSLINIFHQHLIIVHALLFLCLYYFIQKDFCININNINRVND